MDIAEVSRRLAEQAESVARYLLPNGNQYGREWCVGSVNGEEGKSLKVCISGAKQGVWSDFAAGLGGDLIDLWCEVRGVSKGDAFKEAKDYLGIDDSVNRPRPAKQKSYRKPERNEKTRVIHNESPVMDYLTGERKLSVDAIKAYKISETVSVTCNGKNGEFEWQGPWITFPFLDSDNDLVSIKYLHLNRDDDGKKKTIVEENCRPILFGWQAIKPEMRELYITEGEFDAVSMWVYGYPALSVPFGGGKGAKQQWIDHEWERLQLFDRIYLCLDDDEEGQIAAHEIAGRLGMHRCYVVTLPRKDANQCLQDGVPASEIGMCVLHAKQFSPETMKSAAEFKEEVFALAYPSGGKEPGIDLPWCERDKPCIRLKRGQLSLWGGINGHGKSHLLGYVIAHGIDQGDHGFIASLEMPGEKTLFRLVKQVTDVNQPSRQLLDACLDWLGEHLWLYDVVGSAKIDDVLSVCEYAYRRHGCRQFVIDSMMRLGVHSDDFNGQKDVIEAILKFCDETGAHVHLVVHPRKGADEDSPPGKLDMKGGGELTDLAYNVFTVYRNKKKEKELAKLKRQGITDGEKYESVARQADTMIFCDKCRDAGELEGRIPLKFDTATGVYYQHRKKTLFRPNFDSVPSFCEN